MARTTSDYKKCKHCEKSLKMAWYNDNQKWKLVKALLNDKGEVVRDAKNQPIPASPLQKHICAAADGFNLEAGKDESFDPFDVERALEAAQEPTQEEKEAIPAQSSTSTDDLASLIARAVEPMIKGKLDEAKVRAIAAEVVSQATTLQKVENVLVVRQAEKVDVKVDSYHPNLPLLIKILNTRKPDGHRLNVYLHGKPGSGKTSGAMQTAQSLSLPYDFISLSPQTADSRINGFIDATGTFRDTAFYRCYSGGGVFCIDEIDNASDNLLTAMNSALDNGHAAFPCGKVARHPDFCLVVTANTAGRGGDLNHAGRRPLDAATLERFVFIEWQYDLALEEKLTLGINSEAGAWLAFVRKVRDFCKVDYPRLVVSPRSSMNGAMLLASGAYGSDIDALAESVLFKGLDKDTKAKILRACPLPSVILPAHLIK